MTSLSRRAQQYVFAASQPTKEQSAAHSRLRVPILIVIYLHLTRIYIESTSVAPPMRSNEKRYTLITTAIKAVRTADRRFVFKFTAYSNNPQG